MQKELLESIVCPYCKGSIEQGESNLICRNCNISFNVVNNVPQLVVNFSKEEIKTKTVFGFIWDYFLENLIKITEKKGKNYADMRDNINMIKKFSAFPFPKGVLGLDVGCGVGYDLEKLVIENPDLKLFGIDISSGVYRAYQRSLKHKNIYIAQANALNLPFKDNFFDFVYSFGVIHHTSSPYSCFKEMVRVTKNKGLIVVFILKDLSGDNIKKIIMPLIKSIRKITVKLPFLILFILSVILSIPIYIIFVIPAKILLKFEFTKKIVLKFPFWFCINFLNTVTTVLDRLGAVYEYRFSKEDLEKWCVENNSTEFSVKDCSSVGFSGWLFSVIK